VHQQKLAVYQAARQQRLHVHRQQLAVDVAPDGDAEEQRAAIVALAQSVPQPALVALRGGVSHRPAALRRAAERRRACGGRAPSEGSGSKPNRWLCSVCWDVVAAAFSLREAALRSYSSRCSRRRAAGHHCGWAWLWVGIAQPTSKAHVHPRTSAHGGGSEAAASKRARIEGSS